MDKYLSFFTADYRDGMVYINGKRYSAGTFAVKMMNRFHNDDACQRISVFRLANWNVQRQLKTSYVLPGEFEKAGWEIEQIHKTLGRIEPFNLLDLEAEAQRIAEIFTEENALRIEKHFKAQAFIAKGDWAVKNYQTYKGQIDMDEYDSDTAFISDVMTTLKFYDSISDDMDKAFNAFRKFIWNIEEAARFDETHLLPVAREYIKGEVEADITYVPVRKNKKETIARRMSFADYYSFLVTDFYEGLHHGHYPRQCPVCKKYFLMESARRQKYCNGIAPVLSRSGKKITCRKYATQINRKERAADDPVTAAYNTRMNYIRKNESRGIFDHEYACIAKEYAAYCLERANLDDEYLSSRYYQDMSCRDFIKGVDDYINREGLIFEDH